MSDLSNEEAEAVSDAMNEGATAVEEKQETEKTAGEGAAEASPNKPAEESDGSPSISKAQFMQLEEIAEAADLPPKEMERMYDVKVKVEVILGNTKLPLEKILKMHQGSVIELNKLAGEAVDVLANGKLIARAEVVVIEENFGIKILEIVGTKQKLNAVSRG